MAQTLSLVKRDCTFQRAFPSVHAHAGVSRPDAIREAGAGLSKKLGIVPLLMTSAFQVRQLHRQYPDRRAFCMVYLGDSYDRDSKALCKTGFDLITRGIGSSCGATTPTTAKTETSDHDYFLRARYVWRPLVLHGPARRQFQPLRLQRPCKLRKSARGSLGGVYWAEV